MSKSRNIDKKLAATKKETVAAKNRHLAKNPGSIIIRRFVLEG